MAEIKSTLDLVLEKTRNLKMTDEERKSIREKELRGKIKGLIRQYLDGYVPFESEYQNLIKDDTTPRSARNILAAEVIEQFDPARNHSDENRKLITIMEEVLQVDKTALQKSLAAWHQSLVAEREDRMARIKADWSQKQLAGSALIPNLEKDADWKALIAKKSHEFRSNLRALLI